MVGLALQLGADWVQVGEVVSAPEVLTDAGQRRGLLPAAIRTAFDDRSIRRGFVVVEGEFVACQTWIEGTFVREFTESPVGPLPPNGQRVVFDLLNLFRFDDQGRLVEEWVRTDYRSLQRQLGAEGRQRHLAQPGRCQRRPRPGGGSLGCDRQAGSVDRSPPHAVSAVRGRTR
ncbi:ester cyclase [Micromonospora sp. WMMD967]|uniref:ester cyclase n=1 Tax=Micromonospora sp. WMMD967 TaxID=3016101 RepID=UPI002417DD1C|nr:ester cyclase [Micromonospora sp. WMMD967]MDG4840307.1 ester cyclase [Micromonospora sp. WMMD967]